MKVTVIAFAPARILHVALPKTGSTTLLGCYLVMAGLARSGDGVRPMLRIAKDRKQMRAAGLRIRRVAVADLAALRADHAGWHLIATVRNPYDRAVSNWFSKINRYCKAFAPGIHRRAKLRQLLAGPAAWPHIETANRHMRDALSFDAFLAGLTANGINFDNHFRQQADLLGLGTVRYDHLLRLEAFDTAFPATLAALGVAPALTDRLARIPHSNVTGSADRAAALLTPAARAMIDRLYDRDIALLGYAPENH